MQIELCGLFAACPPFESCKGDVCLGDGHELLAKSSLDIHLGPLYLPRTFEQLDKIVQVNYRSQGRILPRSLVNFVRIDHVPVRIMSQQYSRGVRLKTLGELSQGVSCLLELFERPIELVTSPLQLRKHLPSVAISHRISALGPLFARNGGLGGHKRALTHTPSPPKQGTAAHGRDQLYAPANPPARI